MVTDTLVQPTPDYSPRYFNIRRLMTAGGAALALTTLPGCSGEADSTVHNFNNSDAIHTNLDKDIADQLALGPTSDDTCSGPHEVGQDYTIGNSIIKHEPKADVNDGLQTKALTFSAQEIAAAEGGFYHPDTQYIICVDGKLTTKYGQEVVLAHSVK